MAAQGRSAAIVAVTSRVEQRMEIPVQKSRARQVKLHQSLRGIGDFGERDSQNCTDLLRVFNADFAGAGSTFPANPNDLEDARLIALHGLNFHLHSNLQRDAGFDFCAKLAKRYDLSILGEGG